MSAVATGERGAHVADPPAAAHPAERLFEPRRPDGGVTLEDSLLRVWEDLSRDGHAGCPVCGGRMTVAGCCRECGSELS